MNKTVNMNLGGFFFHIDEDAYQKLNRYFDAIKRSLSSDGRDEIMNDIESRISELFSEKSTSGKQVINIKDVDDVIVIMGQPEDYKIENDEPKQTNFSTSSSSSRKLFRDKENGIIGGVLAGLGHYFGIDKVWLRLVMLILLLSFGTGFLLYIILWIVMPEAITTSEKLEMTGEPVNISNIEKKVKEEFENVSEKFKNADYSKIGNQVKSGAERVGSSFGDFIIAVLKVFSKFLGILLIMAGMSVILFLLIGIFTVGTNAFIDFPWNSFIESGNYSDYPIWSFGMLMFFAVGIPFFFLTTLGFKLLSPKTRLLGNIAIYTLLAIWIISIALTISIGIKQASAFANDGRIVLKENIQLNPTDTLHIKFIHNDLFSKNIDERSDFKITQDSANTELIYSNNISFKVEKTDEKTAYLQIEKEAKGKSILEAKQKAEQIRYHYKIVGNQLILDNYLLTDIKNKYRDQEIEITLFVPENTLLKLDKSVENYDRSNDDFFNFRNSSNNYTYKVENGKINCLNCPLNEDDLDIDIENEDDFTINNPNITINKNGIIIKNDTINDSDTNFKGLKINDKGIIIKTK